MNAAVCVVRKVSHFTEPHDCVRARGKMLQHSACTRPPSGNPTPAHDRGALLAPLVRLATLHGGVPRACLFPEGRSDVGYALSAEFCCCCWSAEPRSGACGTARRSRSGPVIECRSHAAVAALAGGAEALRAVRVRRRGALPPIRTSPTNSSRHHHNHQAGFRAVRSTGSWHMLVISPSLAHVALAQGRGAAVYRARGR